jgi:prevent-host-death family protein
MPRTLSKSQFKPRALELFRQVQESGEELIITDRGKPVLRIVPYVDDPRRWLQPFEGVVKRYTDPLEPVGADDWEALP